MKSLRLLLATALVAFTASAVHASGVFDNVKIKATEYYESTPTSIIYFQNKVNNTTDTFTTAQISAYKTSTASGAVSAVGVYVRTTTGSALTEALTVSSNTKVGILTTTPQAQLDVNGYIGLGVDTTVSIRTTTPTAVGQVIYSSTAKQIWYSTGTATSYDWMASSGLQTN